MNRISIPIELLNGCLGGNKDYLGWYLNLVAKGCNTGGLRFVSGKAIKDEIGEHTTSLGELAKTFNVSRSRIELFLKKMEALELITDTKTTQNRQIKILDSNCYAPFTDTKQTQKKQLKPINTELEIFSVKTAIPSLDEVFNFVSNIDVYISKFESLKFSIQSKYESWVDNGWKDGHGKKITNWKSKIKNTLPHLKPINNGNQYKSEVNDKLATAERNRLEYLKNAFGTDTAVFDSQKSSDYTEDVNFESL